MNYERPELLDKLAGAYVLGTMAARARPRFARLLGQSTVAQRAVADWNNKLAPLFHAVAPVAPPDTVWNAIAARTRPRREAAGLSWRERLLSWSRPALGFCVGAIFAIGAVNMNAHMFGMHHVDHALPASYVGVLSDAQGRTVLSAGSHRRGNTMTLKLHQPLAIPPGLVARLWALPEQGAPVPIANVPASGKIMVTLDAPAEEVFAKVPRLALSYERDPAASAPTAPFVLSGPCVKFW